MIKKQLGVLAGSLMLAAGSQAAITTSTGLGSNSSVILVLSGTDNGAFVMETGVDALQLSNGTGFSLDLTAASLALGGDISKWALLGVLGGTDAAAYNVTSGYFNGGLGVVYSSDSGGAAVSSVLAVKGAVADVNAYINTVILGGFFADGTPGDLDETGLGVTMLGLGAVSNGATGNVFLQGTTTGFGAVSFNSLIDILSPDAAVEGITFDGVTFNVTNEAVGTVPVPAAAWLFGSALLGLGVLRRKS